MTVKEKVERYLKEHKRPVTVAVLAYQFLLPANSIRGAIRDLCDQDKLVISYAVTPSGRRVRCYAYNRKLDRPVAVPRPADPPPRRPAAVVNSYPHVRGYDD